MVKEKVLIVEDEFIVAHNLQKTLEKAGFYVIGIADSVKKSMTILEVSRPDFVLLDIYLKGKLTGIDLAKHLLQLQIPFIYISANSNEKVMEAAKQTDPYGFIVKPYRDKDVLLSLDIARFRHNHNVNYKLSSQHYLSGVLRGISQSSITREQRLLKMVSAFQPFIPFDFVSVLCISGDHTAYNELNIHRLNFDEYEVISEPELIQIIGKKHENNNFYGGYSPSLHTDAVYTDEDFDETRKDFLFKKAVSEKFDLRSNLDKTFILKTGDEIILSFYSRISGIYRQEHLDLLNFLHQTLVSNLEGVLDLEKVTPQMQRVHEKIATSSFKTDSDLEFTGIIGNNPVLLNMLDQIRIVSPTDTSVLITGESGTGKELVALNIHRQSTRRGKPMTIVNCAALPSELVETILFGYEKGSFTGAAETKTGKFEETNGGTIFLDEIGEMPLDSQAKLLRVLQEKEIERIGGKTPIAGDVRIIAATNRSLEKEISAGRFRIDLFYRLNVFPILIPPLRDRKSDIPLLIDHFIKLYAKKFNKKVYSVQQGLMNDLIAYSWPGNIRELINVVERGVLLAKGEQLEEIYLDDLQVLKGNAPAEPQAIKTIAENEKDYIISVLQKCNGKISGEGGAAELLGIPATTLNSKIKKLGISR